MKFELVFENTDAIILDEKYLVGFAFSKDKIVFVVRREINGEFREFGMDKYVTTVFDRIKRNDITWIWILDENNSIKFPIEFDTGGAWCGLPNTYQQTTVDESGNLVVHLKRSTFNERNRN